MASAAALNKMAAICCIMLILTMGQLMAADAAPHLQGSRRHLLQLVEREVAVARQPGFKNGRNVVARQPGFKNAPVRTSAKAPATRVRINGPPN